MDLESAHLLPPTPCRLDSPVDPGHASMALLALLRGGARKPGVSAPGFHLLVPRQSTQRRQNAEVWIRESGHGSGVLRVCHSRGQTSGLLLVSRTRTTSGERLCPLRAWQWRSGTGSSGRRVGEDGMEEAAHTERDRSPGERGGEAGEGGLGLPPPGTSRVLSTVAPGQGRGGEDLVDVEGPGGPGAVPSVGLQPVGG